MSESRRYLSLRFDGTRWSPAGTGTSSPLTGVWGSRPDDLWLVGPDGTLLRYRP